ncbi:hypothetical protein, partial [Bradyrhizobium lablabi]|uniref:hypothetical protein n=1 Tax=Bradyrhizobium lablabi TaxID=722472 RepID=UPI001AECD30C
PALVANKTATAAIAANIDFPGFPMTRSPVGLIFPNQTTEVARLSIKHPNYPPDLAKWAPFRQ